MTAKDRDTIVDDLLKKRPSGPAGVYVECTETQEYCYDRRRYVNKIKPSVKHFGYNPEDIFKMGLKDRHDCDRYIRARFFDNQSNWELRQKKATVTRRVNRLWERIAEAISGVRSAGSRGIYTVKCRHDRTGIALGAVYALNKAEALETAKLSYGYLVPVVSPSSRLVPEIFVDFVCIADSQSLMSYNAEITDKVNDRIERIHKDIEASQKQIESLKARLTTISLVEAQMLDLGDD